MFATFHEKNLLAPGKRVLLWSILCWAMFEVGFVLLLEPYFDLNDAAQMYWFQIANFCASFILTTLCFMPFLKDSIANTSAQGFGKNLLFGYGLYMALSFAASMVITVLDILYAPPTTDVNQEIVAQLLNQKSVPMIVCTVILAPVTEECLVRGVLFAPLCKRKPWLAYVVSAVIFALLHVLVSIDVTAVNGITTTEAIGLLESFLTYLPSGIALGWMYQRTGTIIGPIVLHSLNNLIAVVTILWAF